MALSEAALLATPSAVPQAPETPAHKIATRLRRVDTASPRERRDRNYAAAVSALEAGLWDQAATHLASTAPTEPGLRRTVVPLAVAHIGAGRFEIAAAVLQSWLEQHPRDHDARMLLGRAQIAAGDTSAARETTQALLHQSPDTRGALALAYGLLVRSRDFAGARRVMDRLAQLRAVHPDSSAPRM